MDTGAYCRLKNIQLGYSLPGAIINKVGLEKVRIYFSGDNLLTFSGINENFDPEARGAVHIPSPSQYPLVLTLHSKTLKIQKDEKVNLYTLPIYRHDNLFL